MSAEQDATGASALSIATSFASATTAPRETIACATPMPTTDATTATPLARNREPATMRETRPRRSGLPASQPAATGAAGTEAVM